MTEKMIFSESLNQKVTFKKENGWGYYALCEDGTVYTPAETKQYTSADVEIGMEEHLVKKVFKGTIIRVREKS